MSDEVKVRLPSQLIKSISCVLRKWLKYSNAPFFSTSLVPPATVLPGIFCLNVNNALLSLAAEKWVIAPLASKNVSSL